MILAAELCCRIFLPTDYSAKIMFHSVKNASDFFKPGQYYFESDGLILYHDHYFSDIINNETKSKFRIAFLGDSITNGAEIENISRRFTDVLQQRFNNEGYDVEIGNFGVSGYNLAQISYVLHKVVVPKYNPDMIVYNFYENDVNLKKYVKNDEGTTTIYEYESHIPYVLEHPFNRALLKYSLFYRFINKNIANAITKSSPDYKPKIFLNERWDSENILNEMISFCQRSQIPLYIIPLPNLHGENIIEDEFIKEALPDKYDKVYYVSADISKLANASEIRVNPQNAHFNYYGHEIVADLLYRYFITIPEIQNKKIK